MCHDPLSLLLPVLLPRQRGEAVAAAVSRADPSLRRLVRAAVRMSNVIAVPQGPYTLTDAYTNEFMRCDEELREASIAYADGLPEHDRERLAR